MKLIVSFLIITSFLLFSCDSKGKGMHPANKQSNTFDETIYDSLKNALLAGTSEKVNRSVADEILKYYILNEQVDNEENRKLFPQTPKDEALFYNYLNILSSKTDGASIDKDYHLIKMACVTKRAAEWGEALSEDIADKWKDPSLNFIKTVISLPDSERSFILTQTIPEGRDEINDVIRKMDDLEGIKTLQGYDEKIKNVLMEIASTVN